MSFTIALMIYGGGASSGSSKWSEGAPKGLRFRVQGGGFRFQSLCSVLFLVVSVLE